MNLFTADRRVVRKRMICFATVTEILILPYMYKIAVFDFFFNVCDADAECVSIVCY